MSEETTQTAAEAMEAALNGIENVVETEPEIDGSIPPAAEPPKKRRGRPPMSDADRAAKGLKPRGEKVSSGSPKSRRTMGASEVDKLGQQLVGLHKLASMLGGIPELEIQPMEGQLLAQATIDVCNEYGLSLSGKTGAALQLAGVGAMIYVPRFVAFNARLKKEQRERAHSESNIIDMPIQAMQ